MKKLLVCVLLILKLEATLPPGIHYKHLEKEDPLSIHLLEVDPKLYLVKPARAQNDGLGRETVLSIAERQGALAGINGGFFLIKGNRDGQPKGVLKIHSNWYSDVHPKGRAAMGWNEAFSPPLFSRLLSRWSLRIHNQTIPIHNINVERQNKETILYTFAYHRSTLTKKPSVEVLIQNGKILKTLKNANDSPIPNDGFVLSLDDSPFDFKENAPVSLEVELIPLDETEEKNKKSWQVFDFLLGGTPLLIHKGSAIKSYDKEEVKVSFVEEKKARTAVGFTQRGTWLFVVVDGPELPFSIGMTLKELSDLMLEEGCLEAMGLDGGGSSTLVLQGEVLNHPLGDEDDPTQHKERPVSDALLVFPRS